MEEIVGLSHWSSICLQDGGEFCSDDLKDEELHVLGGWRRICCSLLIGAPSDVEDGGEFCSDDLELHLLGGWRRRLLC